MHRRQTAPVKPGVRSIIRIWPGFIRYRRMVLASFLCAVLIGAGVTGYLLGRGEPAQAAVQDEDVSGISGIAAFAGRLADQEDRCAAVEQINLQDELAAAKEKADAIKEKADALSDSLSRQQEEMESLEEQILKALMSNLSDKQVSRASPTVANYCQEAKNLISLSRKLKAFEKTATASEIDLSDYKAAIDKRLLKLPTLKPIPGRLEGYGTRIHPVYGYRQFHPAVDIGAPTGTPIKASASGTVFEVGKSSSAGNFLKISHGNGFTTAYLHCSKIYVRAGARVVKGDVIAAVGNTGTSTTPHLHFEIRYYDTPVNPSQIIMQ